MNLTVRIWRYVFQPDDPVGGAVPSGTVLYDGIQARKMTRMPDQMYFEQGLETIRSAQFMLWPHTLSVKERDEIEIMSPPNHPEYGKRFRIEGEPDFGFHPGDPKGYLVVMTTRSTVAHNNRSQ